MLAIIDINDVHYSQDFLTLSNLSHKNLKNILEEHVSMHKVISDEHQLDTIFKDIYLHLFQNVLYPNKEYKETQEQIKTINDYVECSGVMCYRIDDEDTLNNYEYYLCHIQPDKENKYITKKYNGLATYLTGYLFEVDGVSMIIKANSVSKKIENILMDDVVELFRNVLVHTGLIIGENDKLETFEYIYNPVDWIKANEINNYKYIDILDETKTSTLQIFYDERNTKDNSYVNKLGTKILNKKIDFYGRIIVGRLNQQSEHKNKINYVNLSLDYFNR